MGPCLATAQRAPATASGVGRAEDRAGAQGGRAGLIALWVCARVRACRVVKGFRSLLFAEPHAILTSSLLQDLPPSVIAHHLFTRCAPPRPPSKAPRLLRPPTSCRLLAALLFVRSSSPGLAAVRSACPDLCLCRTWRVCTRRLDASVQAPHERSGLSPAQYSLWLDTHTTPEVLRGVAAVLEAAKLPGPEADPVGHEAAQLILLLCKQVAV